MSGSRVRSRVVAAVLAPLVAAVVVVVGSPAVAFAATALPVVLSFSATHTSVSDSGGSITLDARLKYATSCKLSASPSVKGLPKSFSCSSDSVKETVALPANKKENAVNYSFALVVTNTVGHTAATNVAVSVGASPPPISFTTPSPGTGSTLVFAPEGVFVADEPLLVTVTNNSKTTQAITDVAVAPVGDLNDFILNKNNCGDITAGESCSFAVQFLPTGAGVRTGEVAVVDSSWGTAGTTAILNLQGTGVWATATVVSSDLSDNTLDFPDQGTLTTSPLQYLTLSNAGTVPLEVTGIGVTGGESTDFAIDPLSCQNEVGGGPLFIGVGQNCTFAVDFSPSGPGERTSNVLVYDNTLGTQTQFGVEGTGVNSTTTLQIGDGTPQPSPISYDFGSFAVNSYNTVTLTITNTSAADLDFTGNGATGINKSDFGVGGTDTCASAGVELAPGDSCTVELAFAPEATGPRSATLLIGDNSTDGDEIIGVTGTGT